MAPVTVLMVEGGSVFESNSEGYRISGAVLRIGFGCVLEEMIQGRGWKVVNLCSLSSFTLGSMLIRTMESWNLIATKKLLPLSSLTILTSTQLTLFPLSCIFFSLNALLTGLSSKNIITLPSNEMFPLVVDRSLCRYWIYFSSPNSNPLSLLLSPSVQCFKITRKPICIYQPLSTSVVKPKIQLIVRHLLL